MFKFIEPHLDALEAANFNWSTFYSCKVNFSTMRARFRSTELIEKEELDIAMQRQKEMTMYEELSIEQRRSCKFKPITNHDDNFWEEWSTGAIEVQQVEKSDRQSLFAVSLVKHSADQMTRNMRVIEALDDVTIRMMRRESEQDEWFNCERNEPDHTKKIIKLVSQDDGSQLIDFYGAVDHFYSIAANGDDSIQF